MKSEKIKGGVFYTEKNGEVTDEQIVDEMLDKEEEITSKLVAMGVINDMRIKKSKGTRKVSVVSILLHDE